MRPGAFTKSHLDRLVSQSLPVFLLIHLCLAAPDGSLRLKLVSDAPPSAHLANPFGSGEEERRLLQSYVQFSLKNSSGEPEIHTREQELFYLFRLYDYDRSGFLDGLEMMKLLSDYNVHHSPADGQLTSEQVVAMVDSLLHSQDSDQDGLLTPSELLSPSRSHSVDTNNNSASKHEQEDQTQDVASDVNTEEVNGGAMEPQEEGTEEGAEHHEGEQAQDDTKTEEGEEEEVKEAETDHDKEQQDPEALLAEQERAQRISVHQGQPEI